MEIKYDDGGDGDGGIHRDRNLLHNVRWKEYSCVVTRRIYQDKLGSQAICTSEN